MDTQEEVPCGVPYQSTSPGIAPFSHIHGPDPQRQCLPQLMGQSGPPPRKNCPDPGLITCSFGLNSFDCKWQKRILNKTELMAYVRTELRCGLIQGLSHSLSFVSVSSASLPKGFILCYVSFLWCRQQL